jgi:hypothetical protein
MLTPTPARAQRTGSVDWPHAVHLAKSHHKLPSLGILAKHRRQGRYSGCAFVLASRCLSSGLSLGMRKWVLEEVWRYRCDQDD